MRRKIIPYNPQLKELASILRKNMTLSEVLLWQKLRNKQMLGYDFHRQKPIDDFIVDFYCPDLLLIIEVDGVSHEGAYDKDMARQGKLESFGLTVLRFNDLEVKKDLNSVLLAIEDWITLNNA